MDVLRQALGHSWDLKLINMSSEEGRASQMEGSSPEAFICNHARKSELNNLKALMANASESRALVRDQEDQRKMVEPQQSASLSTGNERERQKKLVMGSPSSS